jgi:alpha-D-ribose 1-methylphosphonate 5-triphosphate synthase subunit PhnH
MTEAEGRTQQTFTALMWALSYPGRARELTRGGLAAFSLVADTLVDLETSYYTDHDGLAPALAATGAQLRPPDAALYQFYPSLTPPTLAVLGDAPRGSYLYPDQSATLVVGCGLGAGHWLELSGPGIETSTTLLVEGIPHAFWDLRARACRFPLGWDIVLLADRLVVGLPRTTRIEVH